MMKLPVAVGIKMLTMLVPLPGRVENDTQITLPRD